MANRLKNFGSIPPGTSIPDIAEAFGGILLADVVAVSNITLSGEQSIDGVTTSASKVLAIGQTDQTENGLYISDAGAWIRADYFDSDAEIREKFISIQKGTTYAGALYQNTNTSAITIGATNITFTRKFFEGDITVGTVNSNFLTIALAKTAGFHTLKVQSDLTISSNITSYTNLTADLKSDGTRYKLTFSGAICTVPCYFSNLEIITETPSAGAIIEGSTAYNCKLTNSNISGTGGNYIATNGYFIDCEIYSTKFLIFYLFSSGAIINCQALTGTISASVTIANNSTATISQFKGITGLAFTVDYSLDTGRNPVSTIYQDVSFKLAPAIASCVKSPQLIFGSTYSIVSNFSASNIGTSTGSDNDFVGGYFSGAVTLDVLTNCNFTNVTFVGAVTITTNGHSFVNCRFLSTISITADNCSFTACRHVGLVTINSGSEYNIFIACRLAGGRVNNGGVTNEFVSNI